MYEAKKYTHLLGLPGMSDALLTNHFTLYEGYVTNTNKLLEKKTALEAAGQTATPEYAELTRRFGWEWNGMRLHEYYFDALTTHQEHTEGSALHAKVLAQFGSAEAWGNIFRATGAMRGIGWVILTYDAVTDQLCTVWINEHDTGHLAGATPLLVMDVFEHAYMLDYGLKRTDYIDAFFQAINWKVVSERFDHAKRNAASQTA